MDLSDKNENVFLKDINALSYAKYLKRGEICRLIEEKMEEESIESRWMKTVLKGEMEEVEKFRNKFQNPHQLKKIVRYIYIFILNHISHVLFKLRGCQNFGKKIGEKMPFLWAHVKGILKLF